MQPRYCDEQLSVPLTVCLSVRPSVRPSVKCVNCDKTKAPSEKSSIMTNRKSPTSSPMSLRWTAYVAHNPQRGPHKRFFRFPHVKLGFFRRKSATKFLHVKTFIGKVVTYSLAYLSVHKWLVGRPLLPEIFGESYPPPSKTATSNRYSVIVLEP